MRGAHEGAHEGATDEKRTVKTPETNTENVCSAIPFGTALAVCEHFCSKMSDEKTQAKRYLRRRTKGERQTTNTN